MSTETVAPVATMLLNRGDYLASVTEAGVTPLGTPVFAWAVLDLSDLTVREPFAMGQTVGSDLAIVEVAQASRERMSLPRSDDGAVSHGRAPLGEGNGSGSSPDDASAPSSVSSFVEERT